MKHFWNWNQKSCECSTSNRKWK